MLYAENMPYKCIVKCTLGRRIDLRRSLVKRFYLVSKHTLIQSHIQLLAEVQVPPNWHQESLQEQQRTEGL